MVISRQKTPGGAGTASGTVGQPGPLLWRWPQSSMGSGPPVAWVVVVVGSGSLPT